MAQNDYLPFATGAGANVIDQPTWAASSVRAEGFFAGLAKSIEANKALRQGTFVAASISEWVNGQLVTVPILDDGNVGTWVSNFDAALVHRIQTIVGGDLTAYLPLVGGTLYLAGASDRLVMQADAGQNARIRYYVAGQDIWSAGLDYNGMFAVADETAGRLTLGMTAAGVSIYPPLAIGSTINGHALSGNGIGYPAYSGHYVAFEWTGAYLVGHVDGTNAPGALAALNQPATFSSLGATGDLSVNGNIWSGGSISAVLDVGANRNLSVGNVGTFGNYITVGGITLQNNGGFLYSPSGIRSANQLYTDGTLGVVGQATFAGGGTAVYAPNGNISTNQVITAGLDVVASRNISAAGSIYSSNDISAQGNIYGAHDISVTGSITAGNVVYTPYINGTQPNGNVVVNGGTVCFPASGAQVALTLQGNLQINGNEVQGPNGGLNFYGGIIVQVISGNLDSQWNYGNIRIFNGSGYQVGGGMWLDSSDQRTKKDIEPYACGLDEIRRLRPVRYKFNGLGGTIDDGKTYHGLIAQDTLDIMPEMVAEEPAPRHDRQLAPTGPEDEKFYTMNCTPLFFALVNAVSELVDRIEQLEAKGK